MTSNSTYARADIFAYYNGDKNISNIVVSHTPLLIMRLTWWWYVWIDRGGESQWVWGIESGRRWGGGDKRGA